MLGFKANSIANPVGGSADFDHGIKEITAFKTYSVGDIGIGDEYVTKPSDGSDVTITVKDGVATFSYPQIHLYIGIGDQVEYVLPAPTTTTPIPTTTSAPTTGILYLNKKLSSTQWEVHNGIESVDDIEASVVVKINKVFGLLSAAIDEIPALLNSQDLVAINSTLQIALYKKQTTENVASTIVIDNSWITDEEHYVSIFTPSDLKTECNSSQRHIGVASDDYYKIVDNASGICFNLQSSYCEIEGLQIDGNNDNANILINYGSISLKKTKVLNNILYNAGYGIKSSSTPEENQIVVGNIIYDVIDGISMPNRRLTAYNNTIIDCQTGINLTVVLGDCRIRNCIVQNCSVKCIHVEPDPTTTEPPTTTLP